MLILKRQKNQWLTITEGCREIRIVVVDVRRGVVRLGIDAPLSFRVIREEAVCQTPKPREILDETRRNKEHVE